jgi:hypothetical protein
MKVTDLKASKRDMRDTDKILSLKVGGNGGVCALGDFRGRMRGIQTLDASGAPPIKNATVVNPARTEFRRASLP